MTQCRFCADWYKSKITWALLLCSFVISLHLYHRSYLPKDGVSIHPFWFSSNIRSHDFPLYPQSRSAMEYHRIQIDQNAQKMFLSHENEQDKNINSSKQLPYSETIFRSASFPIIWLDHQGDVRWNHQAQYQALNYLLEKQFPPQNISTCLSRQLIVLEQYGIGGFFSRHHCFIEQFGPTLYSPSMTLLAPKRFSMSHAGNDDFRAEGLLRYYQSISLCSAHSDHPRWKAIHDHIQSIEDSSSNTMVIKDVHQFLERDESTVKYKYSRDIWKYGYDHVPHRRWLFDRNREVTKLVTYHSPIKLFIDHSNEHIYYDNNTSFDLSKWRPRNSPYLPPDNVLNGTTTHSTISDHIFTSFLRYMFLLFFSELPPRIETSAKLLAHHWSEYLSDKYHLPYNETLSKMAALYIRRGDKIPEDGFWQQHKYWRNISMYVKGIVDEEKRRQINYTTIFVITDDATVMNSIQEYSRDGLTSAHKDESYARQHLYKRDILYNVFAPQACSDPFIRIGFDQFLVNIQFLTDHASLVVGHTDSNVGRFIEEIIYVNRQHNKGAQTRTYVINAPDSLGGTYSYFLSIYSIVWTSLIPQGTMLLFGLIIYYNVRKRHQRLVQPKEQQTNASHRIRMDSRIIRMTLDQVLCSSILLNIRTAYYSYSVLTAEMTKDSYRRAVETLILQISSFIFYLNCSKSFYVNILSSKRFCKVLKGRLDLIYQRMTWWKVQVQPIPSTSCK